jgi:hypothetical protein
MYNNLFVKPMAMFVKKIVYCLLFFVLKRKRINKQPKTLLTIFYFFLNIYIKKNKFYV